eukprot:GHVU01211424.1.p1 GENE.GHVU01211424.1~~GHVU01211424.1.p1  ORF type:complete len:175 (+),score=8.82 GHVU01211424.1:983-1507(+)
MRCRSGQEATVEAQRMKGSMSIPHSSVWHATNCTYQRSQCFDDDATFLHNIQCKNTTVIMSQRFYDYATFLQNIQCRNTTVKMSQRLDVNATFIHPSNIRTEGRAQDGRGPAFAGKHCHPGASQTCSRSPTEWGACRAAHDLSLCRSNTAMSTGILLALRQFWGSRSNSSSPTE